MFGVLVERGGDGRMRWLGEEELGVILGGL